MSLILIFSAAALIFIYLDIDLNGEKKENPPLSTIRKNWMKMSHNRRAKVVFSVPPSLYIHYLDLGKIKKIPSAVTEGGPGRFKRGKTPRPFWNSDGKLIIYRYRGNVYTINENGNKKIILNEKMDRSKETRWSFTIYNNKEWIFGPTLNKTAILIDPEDPSEFLEIFNGGIIDKHCEMTGDGKHIVYDNGKDIFLSEPNSRSPGIKLSTGQSCRPCASPSKFVAWLPAPHTKYMVYFAKKGEFHKIFKAPENEEIYRMNWSNMEKYTVHMYGSRGNTKMTVRNFYTGESLFIGYGWDPDIWVEN